jgi:hypothetical protein
MKLKQESRVLKAKAVASLVSAVEAFNSPAELGRASKVLLLMQHAFEMLLKSALVQSGEKKIFDPVTGRSIGFERCLGLSMASTTIKLSDADAGTLRAIDAMRDDEQHWWNIVPEQLLYLHCRAAITLFDDLLQRVFKEFLSSYLPNRVLPLSVDPPRELNVLLDEEYGQIAALLQPGRRAGHDARARIRTLLAMEAHVQADVRVSRKDVERVARGMRDGETRDRVFPRLDEIATAIDGSGVTLKVHFTKNEGPGVRYVSDQDTPAAAVRQIDLQRTFHRSASELAEALDLTVPMSKALRDHLGIDDDPTCRHDFVFRSQRHRCYSDKAFTLMRSAIREVDLSDVWNAHKPSGRAATKGSCSLAGCRAAA